VGWPDDHHPGACLLQQVVPECGGSCGGHLTWEAAEIIQEGQLSFPYLKPPTPGGFMGNL